MKSIAEHGIREWIEEPSLTLDDLEFRQAVHTILASISEDENLRVNMVLKGGILLAIRYQSQRYTKDIDFSTHKTTTELSPDVLIGNLESSLAYTIEKLGYGLDCRVQNWQQRPPSKAAPTFPSIRIKIGYAYKGSRKHKKMLAAGGSPSVISIDFSFNEKTPNIESFSIESGTDLLVYSITDLIAEKLRSYLQQKERNRFRRQDIYDLHMIIREIATFDEKEKEIILNSLLTKARSRGIEPTRESFSDEGLRERAQKDYHTLADEISGELPDFDEGYKAAVEFYKSLPWKNFN